MNLCACGRVTNYTYPLGHSIGIHYEEGLSGVHPCVSRTSGIGATSYKLTWERGGP